MPIPAPRATSINPLHTVRRAGLRASLAVLTLALAACASAPRGDLAIAGGERHAVERTLTNCAVAAMTHLDVEQAVIAYRVGKRADLSITPPALRESIARCATDLDLHAARSVSGRIEISSSTKGKRQ